MELLSAARAAGVPAHGPQGTEPGVQPGRSVGTGRGPPGFHRMSHITPFFLETWQMSIEQV